MLGFELASESIQPGLINLGRSEFGFDSAHVKYGVWTGPNMPLYLICNFKLFFRRIHTKNFGARMFWLFEGAYRRQQEPLVLMNRQWKNNWREQEKSCLKNDKKDRRHILTPKWSQLGTVSYSIRAILKDDWTTASDKTRLQLSKKQHCIVMPIEGRKREAGAH